MNHRFFDPRGNEFRVYSTTGGNSHDKGDYSGISRAQAGELVDLAAKFFVKQEKAKDYSEAVYKVLAADADLKKAYLEG